MQQMPSGPAFPAGPADYRWRYGDTVASVASAHNTTEQAIRDLNQDLDFDRLAPGARIRVAADNLSCPNGALYAVRAGDSLASIARTFGITGGALMEMNPYADPRTLRAGQMLCVPKESPRVRMRVRFGQTIQDILALHNLSMADFENANPNVDAARLMPGQTYSLP